MTLLQIVQQAMGQLNLPVPVSAIGSTSQDVQQVVALANAVGQEMTISFPWTGLQRTYLFLSESVTQDGVLTDGSAVVTGLNSTTGLSSDWGVLGTGIPGDVRILSVDSGTQVTLNAAATSSGTVSLTFGKLRYPMPSDFSSVINRTQWDRSRRWEMIGPLTPQQWQYQVAGYISSGPRVRWRIRGGEFEIWPIVTSGDQLGFEYISSSWVNLQGGDTGSTFFVNDTDTTIFPPALFVAALRFKYLATKGFDVTDAQRIFNIMLSSAQSQDGGAPVLSMGGTFDPVMFSWDQVPDSGYGPR